MRRQELEKTDLALAELRRGFVAGHMHRGHPPPGPQRRKPDDVAQPELLQHIMTKPGLVEVITLDGESLDLADIRHDIR